MNRFRFTTGLEKAFPYTIIVEGNAFHINGDFRNVIKILRIAEDREIVPRIKNQLIANSFFVSEVPHDPINVFIDFITEKTDEVQEANPIAVRNEKKFDFDFDAEELYISFLTEYSIDLVEIEFLHWYKFMILLKGLSSESSFKQKIELRFKDLSDLKGKARYEFEKAKNSVQLPIEMTEEENLQYQEFNDTWGKIGF